MSTDSFFKPIEAGAVSLKHRVVMSPMTRSRGHYLTGVPSEIMKEYYGQRTSDGGLIITEGTSPCPMGVCYLRAPGIWTKEQIEGWKPVIDRIHEGGGKVFCQLMYAGRVTHKSLLPDGRLPWAPSPVKPAGQHHVDGGKADFETPYAPKTEEVPQVVEEFVHASKCAMEAGFDGVEVHSGNGYIFQQFLAKAVNQRTDVYGGSVEGRCKLLLDTLDACCEAIGADRVGVKLQPGVTFSDIIEPQEDILELSEYIGPELEKRKLAYVCFSSANTEPFIFFVGLKEPNITVDVFKHFRAHYKGTLIINGGLSTEQAANYLEDGTADLVAFAALFLTNRNLPALIKAGKELDKNGMNTKVWYGKETEPTDEDAIGYTDWPFVEA